jgi:Transglycosylase-like domain
MPYRRSIATTLAALAAGGALAAPASAAWGPRPDIPRSAAKPKEKQPPIPDGVKAQLDKIAACESGGDPKAIGGGGTYRGKYQFTYETWAAVGGEGDPVAAPESEQDRRAATLRERGGASQWPVCGA